jgi:peptidoglycan/LPS O-acetylase OafA/YrhL
MLDGWPLQDHQRSPGLDITIDGLAVDEQRNAKRDGILDGRGFEGNVQEGSRPAQSILGWIIGILRPAIFTKGGPRKPLRRTAYLDGLRGFAAFIVYWHHHQLWPRAQIMGDRILENGYGFEDRYFFACLPVIRLFFTGGHFAVSIFFVISGYVLSSKPLSLIYAGEHEKLADNIGSALFRRWLRLHIPVLVTTFAYMTSWHLFGIWTVAPKHEGNYRDEVWRWYTEFKNFTFVFRTGGDPWITYNFHAWSIPVEMRGSIAIYTSALAFARGTKNARLACELGLIFYFMYIVDGWFAAMFMGGQLLCDLDMLARNNDLPRFIMILDPYKKPIYSILLAIALLLGGIPSHMGAPESLMLSPGWGWLAWFKPQAVFDYKWFYLFWSAMFIVAAAPRLPWMIRFFELPFNQWLGRISYSLYLVHGPILWTVGDRLFTATGWYREENEAHLPKWINAFPLSKSGPLGFEMSFLVPELILLPLTLWVAEVVTKLVDEPSVKFSQWAYKQILPKPSQKTGNS